jgi:hypothetical protein
LEIIEKAADLRSVDPKRNLLMYIVEEVEKRIGGSFVEGEDGDEGWVYRVCRNHRT